MSASPTEPAAGPSVAGRSLASWVVLATLICWGSMALHNLWELPISPLAPETTGPLVVAMLLAGAHVRWPDSRVPLVALLSWAGLNLIGGGIISVLPLPFLPFQPEQSVSHYLVHVVYSLGQMPLLVVAWIALVRLGRPMRSSGVGHGSGMGAAEG
jgi:hypothetical protein